MCYVVSNKCHHASNALIIEKVFYHKIHNLFWSLTTSLNGIQHDVVIHHSHIKISWHQKWNLKHFFKEKNGFDGAAWIWMGDVMETLYKNLKVFTKFSSHLNLCFVCKLCQRGNNLWIFFDKKSIKVCKSQKKLNIRDWRWGLPINDNLNCLWIHWQAIAKDDVA